MTVADLQLICDRTNERGNKEYTKNTDATRNCDSCDALQHVCVHCVLLLFGLSTTRL